ncbi:MAG: AAA family ATPase [Alphaproteobacteria bacterium]|nr:AAA family ATPase [Alphaproteobacteria bacterium]
MPRETEHNDNTDRTGSTETCAVLPETYQASPKPLLPPDTTNHLIPILRRRKVMALGIFLLCFGASLITIEKTPPLYHAHAQLSFSTQDGASIYKQLYHLQNSTRLPRHLRLSHIPGSNIVDIHNYDNNAQNAALELNNYIRNYIAQANAKQLSPPKAKKPPSPAPKTPQYLEAENKYLVLKARLSAFINKDGSINLHTDKHLRSEALDTLLGRERKYTYDLEELSLRYGEKHPKMIEAHTKLATVTAQIKEERETLLGHIIDDYITAKTTMNALEKARRNTTSNRQEETRLRANKTPIVQLVEPAQIPKKPVFPDKSRFIGFSILLSLFFGILIPVIVERCRKTFISGQQLSHFFGLPCYALIPKTEGEEGKYLADFVLDNPSDVLTEAVHSLRLNIKLKSNCRENEDKVVLITSSKAGEGKTMLCTWLARLAAKSGERVLLIDANLRDPCLHKALNGRNTTSLVEYLAGKATLKKVTDTADPSGLHIIYGRSIPNSVPDLLSSKRMGELLCDARKSYDLIIIDTPPCLINADARALSAHADLLLYLVGWNKTKRDVIHKGLSQFLSFSRIRTALVLSNIDLKKHIEYGYGEVICDDET